MSDKLNLKDEFIRSVNLVNKVIDEQIGKNNLNEVKMLFRIGKINKEEYKDESRRIYHAKATGFDMIIDELINHTLKE